MTRVQIGTGAGAVVLGNDLPMALIAGPCQLDDHAPAIAAELARICAGLGIGFIFKASFDKANRTRHDSPRGPGLAVGLATLAQIRDSVGCPVLTDVHAPEHCAPVAQVVDVLQIPAFLCRQTDLLLAAGATGAAVQVKKGQFLAPWDMAHVAAKLESTGNRRILLCERGTSFGYNRLVSDFRALPIMAQTGWPVIFDATHSVQEPGGQGGASGGERRFVEPLARAALAVGCAGLFLETHPDPDNAPSDGPNMVPLDRMPALLARLVALDRLTKSQASTA